MSGASDGVLDGLLGIYCQASLLPLLSVEHTDLTFYRQTLFLLDFSDFAKRWIDVEACSL